MTMTKLLLVSILALSLIGFCGAPLQAQNAMQSSGMDMKSKMGQMRAQMEQIQTLMKDNMAKMKSHMETEQASTAVSVSPALPQ